jgi:hypothetical protein
MRAKQYGTAWSRLGKAFPELEIWCVDCDSGGCQITKWNDWLSDKAVGNESALS